MTEKLDQEIHKVELEINKNQAAIHRLERRNEELAHFLGTIDHLRKNNILTDEDKESE